MHMQHLNIVLYIDKVLNDGEELSKQLKSETFNYRSDFFHDSIKSKLKHIAYIFFGFPCYSQPHYLTQDDITR